MLEKITAQLRDRFNDLDFSPQQRRVLFLVFGLTIAIAIGFFTLAQGSSSASPLPMAGPQLIIPSASPIASSIVVDVAGKVAHPGVYHLPTGSRAVDALTMAGQALKGVDLSDINLAHILIDGEEIVVGAPKVSVATSRARGGSKAKATTSGGLISLNTATLVQLESLPGVGPVMAGRIIAYRQKSGAFAAITDLQKISGMGKSKYAEVSPLVRL
jgi:competence protein ComEA